MQKGVPVTQSQGLLQNMYKAMEPEFKRAVGEKEQMSKRIHELEDALETSNKLVKIKHKLLEDTRTDLLKAVDDRDRVTEQYRCSLETLKEYKKTEQILEMNHQIIVEKNKVIETLEEQIVELKEKLDSHIQVGSSIDVMTSTLIEKQQQMIEQSHLDYIKLQAENTSLHIQVGAFIEKEMSNHDETTLVKPEKKEEQKPKKKIISLA